SWGCVSLLGAWLMATQIWRLARGRARVHEHVHIRPNDRPDHKQSSARAHNQLGTHAIHDEVQHHSSIPAEPFEILHPKPHVHDENCNHAHLPEPEELKGNFSWRKAFALAFSIGIRPCTGALLVIIFASAQGLLWAGVLATFAMAIGTAITVS